MSRQSLIDLIHTLELENRSAKRMAVRMQHAAHQLIPALQEAANGMDRQTPRTDLRADTCAGPADDGFAGDNANLIASAQALLDLDASGALVPHGIGGHARGIITAFIARLSVATKATTPTPGEAFVFDPTQHESTK